MAKKDYSRDNLYKQSHKGVVKNFFLKILSFIILVPAIALALFILMSIKTGFIDTMDDYKDYAATVTKVKNNGRYIQYQWTVDEEVITKEKKVLLPKKVGESITIKVKKDNKREEVTQVMDWKPIVIEFVVMIVLFALSLQCHEYSKGDII